MATDTPAPPTTPDARHVNLTVTDEELRALEREATADEPLIVEWLLAYHKHQGVIFPTLTDHAPSVQRWHYERFLRNLP